MTMLNFLKIGRNKLALFSSAIILLMLIGTSVFVLAGYEEPEYEGTGEIGNRVWFDENNNGLRDPEEPGVQGVRVLLKGIDNDAEESAVIGNLNGNYSFKNLVAGQYTVAFTDLPEGYGFTTKDVGTNEDRDSDANVDTGITDIITLADGEINDTVDAGLIYLDGGTPPQPEYTGAIGNKVFADKNANGLQDEGEIGIPGIVVTLNGLDNDIERSVTINNSDGGYLFRNLPQGQYQVTFSNLPDDCIFTTPNVGSDDERDSDADPQNGQTHVITLADGEVNTSIDAGIISRHLEEDGDEEEEIVEDDLQENEDDSNQAVQGGDNNSDSNNDLPDLSTIVATPRTGGYNMVPFAVLFVLTTFFAFQRKLNKNTITWK